MNFRRKGLGVIGSSSASSESFRDHPGSVKPQDHDVYHHHHHHHHHDHHHHLCRIVILRGVTEKGGSPPPPPRPAPNCKVKA